MHQMCNLTRRNLQKMILQPFKFYPTICKYNYLFKRKTMNCQPIFYPNYSSPMMNGVYPSGIIQKKRPSVLYQLCQALKISFSQYYQYCENSSLKMNETLRNIEAVKEKSTICIELQSDDQHKNEYLQKKNQMVKPKASQKSTEIKFIEEKTDLSNQVTNQKIQANQIVDQSNNSNVVTKTAKNKNQKYVKVKSVSKKTHSSVIIPEIDILDAVQIKNMRMDSDEVAKKKKSLLLRNVTNWDDTMNGRKERRQIRMLKN